LARLVVSACRILSTCIASSGDPTRVQCEELQKGCDILIGTPGSLPDFIEPSFPSFVRKVWKTMGIDHGSVRNRKSRGTMIVDKHAAHAPLSVMNITSIEAEPERWMVGRMEGALQEDHGGIFICIGIEFWS
jgi:hypothetical protein